MLGDVAVHPRLCFGGFGGPSHGSSKLGFLQLFNVHPTQPAIDQLIRDGQLAGTAAQLLGTRNVRPYQVNGCVAHICVCVRGRGCCLDVTGSRYGPLVWQL